MDDIILPRNKKRSKTQKIRRSGASVKKIIPQHRNSNSFTFSTPLYAPNSKTRSEKNNRKRVNRKRVNMSYTHSYNMSEFLDFNEEEEKEKKEKKEKEIISAIINKYSDDTNEVIKIQTFVRGYFHRRNFHLYQKNKFIRKKIVEEIVTTELTYLNQLETLRKNFCSCLIGLSESVDINALDSQIQIICSYSRLLLQKLENQLSDWNDCRSKIGDIFLEFIDFLKVYTQYVKYHSSIRKTIAQEKHENQKFKKALLKCEAASKNQSINTLMILPIQRLPRYQLFLENLKEKTIVTHSDYKNLNYALVKMISVTAYVDSREREFEKIRQVLLIQEQFTGKFPWLALPHRKFVKEGAVIDIKKNKERFWFLFNDILIITKVPKNLKYKILSIINIVDISVSDPLGKNNTISSNGYSKYNIFGNSCQITLLVLGNDKRSSISTIKFKTKTPEEATFWIDNIIDLQKSIAKSYASIDMSTIKKQISNSQVRFSPKKKSVRKLRCSTTSVHVTRASMPTM